MRTQPCKERICPRVRENETHKIPTIIYSPVLSFNRLSSLLPNPFIIWTAQGLYLISKLVRTLKSLQSLSTKYSGNGASSSLKQTIDGYVTDSFEVSEFVGSGCRRGTNMSSHAVRDKKGETVTLDNICIFERDTWQENCRCRLACHQKAPTHWAITAYNPLLQTPAWVLFWEKHLSP